MRNVVVTGGSRGIGLGIAQRLTRSGFNVIVIARNCGQALTDELTKTPDSLHFLSWDLAKSGTFSTLAATIRERFGPVYGLLNNAGIGTAGILSSMPDAQIAQVIQMNVISPLTLTKYLIRHMMAARAGRVVSISSVVATNGYTGLAAYSASKASINAFTRSLAREVGSLGITVNAVAPGFIETDMTHGLDDRQRKQIERRSALQRMATVDDVAAAVDFLMSDCAANITGTVMTVDAGNTA